ncbi:4-hydroxyphenylpyruvate dioxygenase [bacterium]|nr:4-hydroxyphenylpyruvate dioxygenase [bacterium]
MGDREIRLTFEGATVETIPKANHTPVDTLPLKRIDHMELWVGNAKQAAYFYRLALGMDLVAYSGPETGSRERASYVLQRDKVRLVVSTPIRSDHAMAEHIHRHGDGVRSIALEVDDATQAFHLTVERGARPVSPPHTLQDDQGEAVVASIATYGDTILTFVERNHYSGAFLPGYQERLVAGPDHGIAAIDHVVGNVELGRMNEWVDFFARVMGFSQLVHFDDQDISTEYSALMSKVMQDGSGKIKFPINEPADGRRKSQIEEYLEFYNGAGVQHIALLTGDIIATVSKMREAGVEFLRVPDAYYVEAQRRVGEVKEDFAAIRRLGILVDRDDEGYLLQIFTKPVEDRPTVFFEVIQRRGSRGFGKGNFKALFEAIEREQALRGNL